MFIKMLMVQTLNGIVNQKNVKKWNSKEDFNFLKRQVELSDSIIISRETYELDKNFYKGKKCMVLNTEKEKIENNIIYTKYSKTKVVNIIEKYNLKQTLLLGGPTINSLLLNDDLIDEIFLTIEPVIFSGDKNIFDNYKIKKGFNFKLKEYSELNENTILLKYSLIK